MAARRRPVTTVASAAQRNQNSARGAITLLTAGFCSSGICGIDGVCTKLKYQSRPIHITPEPMWNHRMQKIHQSWSPRRPKVPATPIMTSVRTTPARMVRFREEKNAAIVASCWRYLRRAKSLSRLPEQPRRGGLRGAAFQALAVGRHRIAEREIHEAREQVGLNAEAGPRRILQGDLDGAEQVEQADDQHQGGVLEEADEGVDQRRDREAQRLRQDHVRGLLPGPEAEGLRRGRTGVRQPPQAPPHPPRRVS